MPLTIQHRVDEKIFESVVEGHRCIVVYTLHNQVMTITHTGVPSAVGGRGIAAEITAFVLKYAKNKGLKVVPQCSYTAAYIHKHPEFTTLLA